MNRQEIRPSEAAPNRAEITHGARVAEDLQEIRFDRRSLDAFGQIVHHFVFQCQGDFEWVLEKSIMFARQFKLDMPPDPAAVVRRIIDASR